MTSLLTQIDITLQVPVPVTDKEGKQAERGKITLRRPKTKHAKRLAALIGPDLLKGFLSSGDDKVDTMALVGNIVEAMMTTERAEGLTAVLADMLGETPEFVDDIDVVDLPEIGRALLGFFPALQSLVLSLSAPDAPLPIVGGHATSTSSTGSTS